MLTNPRGPQPAIVISERAKAYVREYYMRLPVKKWVDTNPRDPLAHPLKKKIDKYIKEHKYVSQHKLKKSAERKLKRLQSRKTRTVGYKIIKNKAPNSFRYAVQRIKRR